MNIIKRISSNGVKQYYSFEMGRCAGNPFQKIGLHTFDSPYFSRTSFGTPSHFPGAFPM